MFGVGNFWLECCPILDIQVQIFIEMEQKNIFFFEKEVQNRQLSKFLEIDPRIDWCEEHWCGSTYIVVRLSDISSKTGKKYIFGVLFLGCFGTYAALPYNQIGWARSMPFTSINPNPNLWNFCKIILRIGHWCIPKPPMENF